MRDAAEAFMLTSSIAVFVATIAQAVDPETLAVVLAKVGLL